MRLLYRNLTHTLSSKMAMEFAVKLYLMCVNSASVFVLESVFTPHASIKKAHYLQNLAVFGKSPSFQIPPAPPFNSLILNRFAFKLYKSRFLESILSQ